MYCILIYAEIGDYVKSSSVWGVMSCALLVLSSGAMYGFKVMINNKVDAVTPLEASIRYHGLSKNKGIKENLKGEWYTVSERIPSHTQKQLFQSGSEIVTKGIARQNYVIELVNVEIGLLIKINLWQSTLLLGKTQWGIEGGEDFSQVRHSDDVPLFGAGIGSKSELYKNGFKVTAQSSHGVNPRFTFTVERR